MGLANGDHYKPAIGPVGWFPANAWGLHEKKGKV